MRKNKSGVVYTCVTGEYDEIVNHSFVHPDWDYVCFTDHPPQNEKDFIWKFLPLVYVQRDDVRNSRWHKMHPHCLFPDYQKSLYVDGNVNILTEAVFEDVAKIEAMGQKMAIGPHFARKNIYEEFAICRQLGKDNLKVLRTQEELFKKAGFSGQFGVFFETNILFRRQHDEQVKKIMEDWWWWIENYSRRDQLSLTFVLWKLGVKLAIAKAIE